MTPIKTQRLTLRWITDGDAAFVRTLLNDPFFIRNITDKGVRTLEDARDYIRDGPVASYEQHGFGLYLVERNDTGEPMGMSGLVKRDALDDVDIGFAFLPEYWSQGYAVESAFAVKQHAFSDFGLARLVAITNPDNTGSIRVLEKIGMRFESMVTIETDGPQLCLYAIEKMVSQPNM